MRSSMNLTACPVTFDSAPAIAIALLTTCLLPKLPPVYMGWKFTMWGGSFGSKHVVSKAIAIAGALSKVTGHAVKFMEDRIDNLAANDSQAPDRIYDAQLGVTNDGKFLGLRLYTIDDYGAYFVFAITGNT